MFRRILKFIKNDYSLEKNFIIVGMVNTFVGYWIGIIAFKLLYIKYGIFVFGFVSNFLSITFSFFSQKFFVFKTEIDTWFKEYLKSFLVYGTSAIINFIIIWICIERFFLNIYISQAISIICSVIIVYSGHKYYTFRK